MSSIQRLDRSHVVRGDVPRGIRAVIFIPDLRLSTAEMRKVLPAKVPRDDAVANLGRVALGVAGTAMGLTFGYAASFYLETVRIGTGPVGIGVDHLLVSREPGIYLQSAVLALSSAAIASILPARAAGRLAPIQIIRSTVE